ncbi:MAG: HIT domain-containing protein [Vicinamibacterales bacterium]|jgi:ATP adenylyltransferase|nr:HIT domain-containing protein [Vicinamibacterales bacterium]MDP6608454.1 HIT domain-containing protein [Vicinamibacterales bacterium]|tara:strand:+ start:2467 stop:2985 length:519 start_codon:yes stop_codon:yes gene_type:complete
MGGVAVVPSAVERLWSPWRFTYVSGIDRPEGCVFCDAATQSDAPLVVFRGTACYVILNLYPYTNGHLMVVPVRHVASLAATTAAERAEMMELTQFAERALAEAYRPHGLNVGINLGRAGGAGIVDHVHMHVVPRWDGDTNFMTSVAESRVLPETLEGSAEKLRPIFAKLASE